MPCFQANTTNNPHVFLKIFFILTADELSDKRLHLSALNPAILLQAASPSPRMLQLQQRSAAARQGLPLSSRKRIDFFPTLVYDVTVLRLIWAGTADRTGAQLPLAGVINGHGGSGWNSCFSICGHDGIGRQARFRCCHLSASFQAIPRRIHSFDKRRLVLFL